MKYRYAEMFDGSHTIDEDIFLCCEEGGLVMQIFANRTATPTCRRHSEGDFNVGCF